MWFQVEDLHVILLTLKKCSLWRSISLVSAPYHFLISKISRMFCSPWIASWENLTNVLTLPTTYMYEDLWFVETCDERSLEGPNYCQFKNRLLTQRQHSTLQQTTWCTMLQVLPNQSYTTAYSSLIAVMSLQLTKNHSIILVPMEETLLHKLQSTESRSRYLQIPDCYKLSNGRFDVKHFLPVFYFHVLALNCTDATYSNYQLYSLGYQSRPCDIFMNLLSSSLPFTYFQ